MRSRTTHGDIVAFAFARGDGDLYLGYIIFG